MVSADKDEEEKTQEKSSDSAVQKDGAWTKLLFDYHKVILSTWDFGIGMRANWLKASSEVTYYFN
jgi:hypothetical protein